MPSPLPPYASPSSMSGAQPTNQPNDIYTLALRNLNAQRGQQQMLDTVPHSNLTPLDQGSPFEQITVDLAATAGGIWADLGGSGTHLDREGYALYFRREGTNPQARLNVNMGGVMVDFYPGQRIVGYFKAFDIQRTSRSASVGNARLVILKRPTNEIDWSEPSVEIVGEDFSPIDLIGTSASATFTAYNTATAPTGAAPTGSFDATGYSAIRLLIDTLSANQISFDLVPWIREPNTGLWFEQGTERISIPAPDVNQRYRVARVPVNGRGLYYFDVRNPSAALASIGLIAQALAS